MAAPAAFGTVLRAFRTAGGLTQEELAEGSGLSVRAIRNLEIGRTGRPQRQSVALLAGALGLAERDHAALLAAAGRRAEKGRAEQGRSGRCELPPDVGELCGRDAVIAAMTGVLTGTGSRCVLVSGGPGTGRTALAVQVAHRLRDRFPDGQLFADLDEPGGGSMPVDAVLARLLRSLDVLDAPGTRDERAALVRAELAARRVLVVLDNVACESQVRPLLTGGGPGAVLITSRRDLVALPGVHPVRLDPLAADCARRALWLMAGDRVRAEPGAARAVADACGRLPLALHVAGAWLAAHPHRPLADLAARLADDDLVLDRLAVADLSVRASIAAHVARLRRHERTLLHQLAHADPHACGDAVTADVLAGVLGVARAALCDDLDALTQANMLTRSGAGYRMNPLVRRYAREEAGLPRPRVAPMT